MWRFLFMMIILVTIGCGEELPHPNQQAIDRAEKHDPGGPGKAAGARGFVRCFRLVIDHLDRFFRLFFLVFLVKQTLCHRVSLFAVNR